MGVNFYQDDRIEDLKGAALDAWNFYHVLASPRGGRVDPSRMRLLLNQDATRANVEGALGNFLKQACPQDRVFIFFAGHGSPEPKTPDDAFLLVHDTDLDNMVGTAISMRQLPQFLKWRANRAGNLVMFVDACHSGNIRLPGQRGTKGKASELRSERVNAGISEVTRNQMRWGAITATASGQYSYESDQGWGACDLSADRPYTGGLFTCHLLGGLTGRADANHDGAVDLGELRRHLDDRVTHDSNGHQVPQLSGNLPDDVTLASNPRYAIPIPTVPEKYTALDHPSRLTPWVIAGASTTAVAATAGLLFFTREQTVTDDINAGRRNGDLSDAESERATWRRAKAASLTTAALVGAASLAGLARILTEEPQDVDDVYLAPPSFEIDVTPQQGGGSLSITLPID